MTIGEKLQKLRRARGLSQEGLAEMLSVTRQTISKWELSQSTPDLDYIAKLSDVFGVTTDYLIKPEAENTADAAPRESMEIQGTATGQIRHSALFILGLVVACIGMLGMTAFVIASSIYPCIYEFNGTTFRGVVGYLLHTRTFGWFLLLLVILLVGLGVAVWEIIRCGAARKQH